MIWGTFTPAHIVSLALVIIVYTLMEIGLKPAPKKVQIAVLGALSMLGIGAIVYNLLAWGSPWEYLPLHLCSLNALILPIAVWTRRETIGNLLLLWSLGAFVALVINAPMAECSIVSWPFFFYYVPHMMECIIPVLLFRLRLVRVQASRIVSTVGITMGTYTVIHWINTALNSYFAAHQITGHNGAVLKVNYMFSIYPADPVMELFYQWLPVPYWYAWLVIPVIVAYLVLVYGIVYFCRSRRREKQVAK